MRVGGAHFVSNPVLSYRLDPGEPGFATRAPASRSPQLVTAQELRNRVRLQRQALAEGRQVIFAHSKFVHGQDGAFWTVKGGLTIVASTERPAGQERSSRGGQEAASDKAADSQESTIGAAQSLPTNRESEQKIEEEKRQITLRLRQTEEALAETERADRESEAPLSAGADAGTARLRYEVDELRREKAKMEARELMRRLAELEVAVKQAAAQARDHVLGLVGAGAGPAADSAPAGAAALPAGLAGPYPGRGLIRAHAAGGLFNALV